MKTLPRTIDALRGLRAASWVRESTVGQYDNFGPDAQREQVARAIERYGLVDSGVDWTVAHSGWRIAAHPAWGDMLSRAGGAFDVLVVGYASRFARSLEAHVDARRAFHAAGAAILFADERILSSDDDAWDAAAACRAGCARAAPGVPARGVHLPQRGCHHLDAGQPARPLHPSSVSTPLDESSSGTATRPRRLAIPRKSG